MSSAGRGPRWEATWAELAWALSFSLHVEEPYRIHQRNTLCRNPGGHTQIAALKETLCGPWWATRGELPPWTTLLCFTNVGRRGSSKGSVGMPSRADPATTRLERERVRDRPVQRRARRRCSAPKAGKGETRARAHALDGLALV